MYELVRHCVRHNMFYFIFRPWMFNGFYDDVVEIFLILFWIDRRDSLGIILDW